MYRAEIILSGSFCPQILIYLLRPYKPPLFPIPALAFNYLGKSIVFGTKQNCAMYGLCCLLDVKFQASYVSLSNESGHPFHRGYRMGFVWAVPLFSMPGTGLTMIVLLQNVAVLGQGLEGRNVPHLSSCFSQTVLLQLRGHLLGCLSMCLGKCGPVVGPFIADVPDGWSTVNSYLLASGDRISMQTAQYFISLLGYHVTLLTSEKSVVTPESFVFLRHLLTMLHLWSTYWRSWALILQASFYICSYSV